jgi:hypothetical protein
MYGPMVYLWQLGNYHYQVECEGKKIEIFQPIEEAELYFRDVVNGYPIGWIKQ